MQIRPYTDGDAEATLAVFRSAVTETATADYSARQIAAWAGPADRHLGEWNTARSARTTFVAIIGRRITGFADVDDEGYIGMMFVDAASGRRGVGSALLSHLADLARTADANELSTNASLTARPFFEHHGFVVVAERHPVIRGVTLTNYRMTRQLR